MAYIETLKKRFTKDEFLVIFAVLCLSLPYYINVPLLLIEVLYLLYTKKIISAFKNTPKSKYLLLFILLSTMVSIFYQNWIGVGCCAGILLISCLLVFYRQTITKDLFEFILDIIIVCSILWAIYGFYEYMVILQRHGIDHFIIKIYSRRENRTNSVFANSNYYAMMIEFALMAIGYKIFTTKNKKNIIYYLVVAFINFFLLLLTGCRTAWPAVGLGAIVFLIVNKNYKWCAFIGACGMVLIGVILLKPSLFPRFDSIIRYFGTRQNIWTTAIKGIKAHPLFGQGPMTYMMICEKYGGHITHHAHSVYLDPILSFGIIGVVIALGYIIDNIKRLFLVYKNKWDLSYVALSIACVVVLLIHGIMDYTIFFPHTALFFLLITSAFSMYTRKSTEK